MNKRFLVVVHTADAPPAGWWLQDTARRDWDLAVVRTGPAAHGGMPEADGTIVLHRPGPKWPAIARLMLETRSAWSSYEYVWIADAAIESGVDDVNRLFAAVAALGVPLAQPALAADGACAQPVTLHNESFALRFANRVDPAVALFSRELLLRALPLLAEGRDEDDLGARLPALLEDPARQCAIVDRIVVRRSAGARPLRPSSSGAPALSPAGYDRDGRLLRLDGGDAASFLARLAAGWSALDAARREPLLAAHRAAAPAVRTTAPAAARPGPPAALTLATTLAVDGGEPQRRAVEGWHAAGISLVAFNTASEIRTLRARHPDVRFVQSARAPGVDELLAWFRGEGLTAGGWLRGGLACDPAAAAGLGATIVAALDGGLLYARRDGALDAVFWDVQALAACVAAGGAPRVGDPHWAEHALLLPLAAGRPVRSLHLPLVEFRPRAPLPADPASAMAVFERIAATATWRPRQDPRLTGLLKYLLPRRDPAAADAAALDEALCALLQLWFDDVLARNDGEPAEDTDAPRAGPAPAAAPASAPAVTVALAPDDGPVPELSVVMPTFNRADILRRCLAALAGQTLSGERFEVIVVDDGSSDDTEAVLAAAPAGLRLTRLRQSNSGPAVARNRGLEVARGRWVMFLNDDAILAPDALRIHLEEHARRGPCDAVLGSFLMHPEFTPSTRPIGWCMDHTTLVFDYPLMRPGRPYGFKQFYTCNISIAREFVVAVGGFDEGFVRMGAEDIEIGLRLQRQGCRVYYRPDCVALHAHALDADGLSRMFEFRGRGGVHLHAVQPQLPAHYEQMPVERIAEFRAIDGRLLPVLRRLRAAVQRVDGLDCVVGEQHANLADDPAAQLDYRFLWVWTEEHLQRFAAAVAGRIERFVEAASSGSPPSLGQAAKVVYPALEFIKWYHDTLGVMNSAELPGYLARRAAALPRAA